MTTRQRGMQGELPFPKTWGGRRKGAGRKARAGRRNVAHRARPKHSERHPVHVTLRSTFRPLRSQHVFPTVCFAIRDATRREPAQFRVLHFSVQWDHVHLVVEASDKRALSSGIRSIAIRIARYVNELVMGRDDSGRIGGTGARSRRRGRCGRCSSTCSAIFANTRGERSRAAWTCIRPESLSTVGANFRALPIRRSSPDRRMRRWVRRSSSECRIAQRQRQRAAL